MNINKVTIAGNITKPIELKSLPSGVKVAQITLATNRTYKDKTDNKVEEVQFVDFVSFGKQAETLAEYCVKGQNMYFVGRLSNRSWDKLDGSKGYKTEIILEEFQFGQRPDGAKKVVKKEDEGADNQGYEGFEYTEDKKKKEDNFSDTLDDLYDGEIDPNDIPF
jgi:single-strand DNA-binding protein